MSIQVLLINDTGLVGIEFWFLHSNGDNSSRAGWLRAILESEPKLANLAAYPLGGQPGLLYVWLDGAFISKNLQLSFQIFGLVFR